MEITAAEQTLAGLKRKDPFFLWRLTFVASICKSNYTTESYMKKMPWGLYRKIITNLMYMYDI